MLIVRATVCFLSWRPLALHESTLVFPSDFECKTSSNPLSTQNKILQWDLSWRVRIWKKNASNINKFPSSITLHICRIEFFWRHIEGKDLKETLLQKYINRTQTLTAQCSCIENNLSGRTESLFFPSRSPNSPWYIVFYCLLPSAVFEC